MAKFICLFAGAASAALRRPRGSAASEGPLGGRRDGYRNSGVLGTGKPALPEWLAAQAKELARIQQPSGEVLLAAARPVKIVPDELEKRR